MKSYLLSKKGYWTSQMNTNKKGKLAPAHDFFSRLPPPPTSLLATSEPPAQPSEHSLKVAKWLRSKIESKIGTYHRSKPKQPR